MTKKDGGASAPVTENYTFLLGNTIVIDTDAIRIDPGLGIDSYTCIVQASHDNTGRVLVGNQHVQSFELEAGEAVSIPAHIGVVYVRGSLADQRVNWLAGA